ncbi:dihydrofolate reductase-like isoform X3 [Macadamia integrifolia]|uniref:dihydrofolate reductase-like isoform X1 n=1 Tax=Macadamia integrifolia TaxID=60698 RepID=UPI001C4F14E9|nr:dihydrofolate reductase-like isoform X1 [Macadamia integrifolia]XP_042506137.1 dihydrofolate reductase-like isoform X2 [Macadamia integrifolia]XP_042506138.1 dihydrofolate reductase-like isoform X3 [Macadamia integrifolia]
MGKVAEGKRMKMLCLHGFRTSGSFLQKQISKWDQSIFSHFDMVFPDGLFPAGGKSDIEGIFPPPYFEWFQFNKEFTEYTNLDECITYLCDYITTKGPFDGLLGFSQGATLSALLLGYQAQGKVLKEHPPMKLFVSISGSKFREPKICDVAYKEPIKAKSVHFIGAKDWLKLPSEELATAFENPLIIRHPQGHTVPRLDEQAIKKMKDWTSEILQSSDVSDKGFKVQNGEANVMEQAQQEVLENGKIVHESIDLKMENKEAADTEKTKLDKSDKNMKTEKDLVEPENGKVELVAPGMESVLCFNQKLM